MQLHLQRFYFFPKIIQLQRAWGIESLRFYRSAHTTGVLPLTGGVVCRFPDNSPAAPGVRETVNIFPVGFSTSQAGMVAEAGVGARRHPSDNPLCKFVVVPVKKGPFQLSGFIVVVYPVDVPVLLIDGRKSHGKD